MSDLKYSIEFDSDTSDIQIAQKALGELNTQANKLGKASNGANNFADVVAKIRVGRQGLDDIKALIDSIEQAGGSVNTLKERYKQLKGAWNALNPNEQSQRVRRLRESLAGLGSSVQEAAKNSHKLDNALAETS